VEQQEIVDYIDEGSANLDAGIVAARRQTHLLVEYRTRLIADVVTGKLDVGEVAARLPEEDEELEPLSGVEGGWAAEGPADDLDPVPEQAGA